MAVLPILTCMKLRVRSVSVLLRRKEDEITPSRVRKSPFSPQQGGRFFLGRILQCPVNISPMCRDYIDDRDLLYRLSMATDVNSAYIAEEMLLKLREAQIFVSGLQCANDRVVARAGACIVCCNSMKQRSKVMRSEANEKLAHLRCFWPNSGFPCPGDFSRIRTHSMRFKSMFYID